VNSKEVSIPYRDDKNKFYIIVLHLQYDMFQSLIGTIKTEIELERREKEIAVSIPYRDDKNKMDGIYYIDFIK